MPLEDVKRDAVLLLLCALFVVSDSQKSFCSEDDKIVNCVPCTTISNLKRFLCPQQCNNQAQRLCTEVCNKFCLNNQCKYVRGSLECSEGCIGGLTGKYCHEPCPGNCARCDQFTGKCICEGEHCTEKPKLKSKPSAKVSFKKSTMQTPKKHNTLEKAQPYLKTTSAVPLEPDNSTFASVQSETSQENHQTIIIATVLSFLAVVLIVTAIVLLIRCHCSKSRHQNSPNEKNENDYDRPDMVSQGVYYTGLRTQEDSHHTYVEL